MSKFATNLIIEPNQDQSRAVLFYPLVYQSDLIGSVVVPKGFETDFASIPRLFWNILPPFGSYGEPAIVHDFLYHTQRVTRKQADDVLLEAMEVHGVSWLKRWTIYSAVRAFGWAAWMGNKKSLQPT